MRENTKEREQQERVGRRIEIVVPRIFNRNKNEVVGFINACCLYFRMKIREKDKQIKIRYCCMCRSK